MGKSYLTFVEFQAFVSPDNFILKVNPPEDFGFIIMHVQSVYMSTLFII